MSHRSPKKRTHFGGKRRLRSDREERGSRSTSGKTAGDAPLAVRRDSSSREPRIG
ncbi:MAG: hypothetical protein GX594_01940 [Pirellulaceae bacterium]|nr:hypothetical protein [Pirellulaceae bacterium]